MLLNILFTVIWRHMVSDEGGNLLLPHGLLFPIGSKGSFICIIPETGQGFIQNLWY